MADTPDNTTSTTPAPRKRRAAGRPVGAPAPIIEIPTPEPTPVAETAVAEPAKRTRARKATAKAAPVSEPATPVSAAEPTDKPAPRKRTRATKASATVEAPDESAAPALQATAEPVVPAGDDTARPRRRRATSAIFIAPEIIEAPASDEDEDAEDTAELEDGAFAEMATESANDSANEPANDSGDDIGADGAPGTGTGPRRRRRRGGRGRNRGGGGGGGQQAADSEPSDGEAAESGADDDSSETTAEGTARRRKRRRAGEDISDGDGPNTVVRVREPRNDQVRSVSGSTRLEAKRQRRKDNRDTPRRRAPLLTESEFLARRESVERVMLVRQAGEKTQIAVLEDGILAEHYVTRASTTSYAGNVYLGKVQNVLPSMEAAFVDIGKGRNAVLYAGEVNYDLSAVAGKQQRIEQALSSGQDIMVQVTKDPIGHKGARLTSQISLPGRFLVYVPGGSTHGISRKLPDTERSRLKSILKRIVPEDAGVIIRTAAEGASEEDLQRDVDVLSQQWEAIEKAAKAKTAKAPMLLHSEPDLVVRVIRDIFNEDVKQLIVQGTSEAQLIEDYVGSVAPDLAPRISRWDDATDIFEAHRVDEQLQKALDRKVNLPSGGYLIIERTEAMTVVDVNTGKFVGKGGNLEETVTKNNLESAEEIVRQLRLRDVGGIIVIDFVDMVLEANRDLVLRRLIECLGRDRTKHNVAEVTSLGLVQMTRKRVGQGLLEAFSETCEHCHGRGHVLTLDAPEATKRKGKGIPAAMIPKRTPVEDAIAAANGSGGNGSDAAADAAEESEEEVAADAAAAARAADAAEDDVETLSGSDLDAQDMSESDDDIDDADDPDDPDDADDADDAADDNDDDDADAEVEAESLV